ncbi:hypothetical protein ZIOFF_023987 [Zingiber officinale]|uniref:Sesquiterpene synthase n=1 Tax=Zingiber officinale TaxID=94328 RepID=A0A8J5H7C0_ZINOF|nr:hypothetical protein ZIOFF_023987 [Zingiber officinale]
MQVMELADTPSVKVLEDVVVDRQVAGFDPSFWGDYFITNQKSQIHRQKGFNISSDIFKKYKDKEGKFMEELKDDAKGLLSLYNAAYFGTKKETILDEAISFTKDNLTSLLKDLNPIFAKLVSLTLKTPIQPSMKGLFTRCYISIYQDDPTRNETILELAKLDFNILQCLHQEELKKLCMWSPNAVIQLPEYLRDFFLKMLSIFQEFENELAPEEKFRILYLKEQWKILAQNYFKECQWRDDEYVPKLEEHMRVSIISVGFVYFYCAFLSGMEEAVATKDAFEWFASFPKIIEACATIVRITNDITSKEREQKRAHVASTVDCYMKEYGTSKDVACEKLLGFVEDAWKIINEELLTATGLSREVIEISFHSAQTTEFVYKHVDAFTEPNTSMKESIFFLLVHPIPI